ncbi:MatE protein [Hydrogenispora ethanolica]|uniref:MatE protein n=1 Tax=Hydrogenispora ethanolica TaxID=1082276 RepID=A0A4R1R995_HYDET|nr:MatE protein [Hydrogenispora ethanolica]
MNNSLIQYGGDVAISAIGVVNSIAMLILMPIFGINQGVQPIIGYNYGAKQYDRVKKTLKLGIIAATLVTVAGFCLVEIFPKQLVSLFNATDRELIRMGAQALRTFLCMLPIIGFQIVGANYFQAIGKPLQAMLLSLSRQVLVLIPALIILPRFFGLKGVFYAGPTADLISSVVTGLVLFYELRHLDRKHIQTSQANAETAEALAPLEILMDGEKP